MCTRFSHGLGTAGLVIGLHDLRDLFQANPSMVLMYFINVFTCLCPVEVNGL